MTLVGSAHWRFTKAGSKQKVKVLEATVTNTNSLTVIGEHTKHGINFCQGSKSIRGILVAKDCPKGCNCGSLYMNAGYDYHKNRPEVVGNTRIGNWGSGSNAHKATETSNYVTGFGVRTKGTNKAGAPTDPAILNEDAVGAMSPWRLPP